MKKALWVAATIALFTSGLARAKSESEQCACPHSHSHIDWQSAWYAGGGAMYDTIEATIPFDGGFTARSNDEADVGYRVFAGFTLLRHVGLEVAYADVGEASASGQSDGSGPFWAAGPVSFDVGLTGFEANLVGRLPLPAQLSVVGQAGILSWTAEQVLAGATQSSGPGAFSLREKGDRPIFAARLEYDGLPHARIAAGYAQSEHNTFLEGDLAVRSWSLSAAYLFQ
jgi:hypothetical protein